MKLFAILLFTILYITAHSQESKKIYLDHEKKKTRSHDYVYYRIINTVGEKIKIEDYYPNGQLQMSGTYLSIDPDEIRDGHFLYYSRNGEKILDEYYHENVKEGESFSYDTVSHFNYKVYFKNGKLTDTLTGYYPSGAVRRTEKYLKDTLISGHCYDEKGNEVDYFPIQVMPYFPGGEEALMTFIKRQIKYPEVERADNIGGRVLVSFIVDNNGTINSIGIKKGVTPAIDREALRVVGLLPPFKPGTLENSPVRVKYLLPIMFNLR